MPKYTQKLKEYFILNSNKNMESNLIPKNTHQAILVLKEKGHTTSKIATLLGCNRKTVTRLLKKQDWQGYKSKVLKSSLDPYKDFIDVSVQ